MLRDDQNNLIEINRARALREFLKHNDLLSVYRELSSEMEISDFTTLNLLELHSQAILARVLTSIGCHETSLKMVRKIKAELDERFVEESPMSLYIYSLGSSLFYNAYKYPEALEWIKNESDELFEDDLFGSHGIRNILYRGFVEGVLDKKDEAEFLDLCFSKKFDEVSRCIFLIQYLRLKCFLENDTVLLELSDVIELINQWQVPNLIHKYHFFKARIFLIAGNISEAIKEIIKGQELCPELDLNSYLEILFFKCKIDPELLQFNEKVLLACSITFSPYSHLYGNRYLKTLPKALERFSFGLEASLEATSDCWLMQNNQLLSINYSAIKLEDNFIDLNSGALKMNGELTWLSKNRANCLMTIIGGGHIGVPEELIAERVYQDDLSLFHSVKGRSRDLVTQLINLGIAINRSHRNYQYCFSKNSLKIIFPKDHLYKDKLVYLRKHTFKINNELVCQILDVKIRTASELIKQWKLEKKIAPCSSGRYGEYELSP